MNNCCNNDGVRSEEAGEAVRDGDMWINRNTTIADKVLKEVKVREDKLVLERVRNSFYLIGKT